MIIMDGKTLLHNKLSQNADKIMYKKKYIDEDLDGV